MPTIRRIELLGVGGMGEVYRAELVTSAGDGTDIIRPVAVKYMRPADDVHLVGLFEREARVIAALSHPAIVALIDVTRDQGNQLAIIMELVDGIALSRLTNQPLPLPAVVAIAARVLEALAHAHERGIVHRDVTPHNVLLSRAGEVKLADFGLAKFLDSTAATLSGAKGKVGYMAPEQVLDKGVDQRTDLFGLGVMLYQLSTGKLPFGGGALVTFSSELLTGTYTLPSEHRPDIQPELEAIIVRLLEHDRDNRFASAADVLAALAELPAAGADELAALVLAAFAPAARPLPGPQPAGERLRTRTAAPLPQRRRLSRSRWSAAGVAAALAACVATWMLMEHPQRSTDASSVMESAGPHEPVTDIQPVPKVVTAPPPMPPVTNESKSPGPRHTRRSTRARVRATAAPSRRPNSSTSLDVDIPLDGMESAPLDISVSGETAAH